MLLLGPDILLEILSGADSSAIMRSISQYREVLAVPAGAIAAVQDYAGRDQGKSDLTFAVEDLVNGLEADRERGRAGVGARPKYLFLPVDAGTLKEVPSILGAFVKGGREIDPYRLLCYAAALQMNQQILLTKTEANKEDERVLLASGVNVGVSYINSEKDSQDTEAP